MQTNLYTIELEMGVKMLCNLIQKFRMLELN